MKKSLAHLPPRKIEEIEHIARIIRKESKYAEMIILFGSFARGDWVEDVYVEDNTTYEYRSDYDILVITDLRKMADKYSVWDEIARKAGRLPIRNHVTIIAHEIEYVNAQLAKSQYFFSDIIKEGIMLYDSGKLKLAQSRECDTKQRAINAKEGFEQWFQNAADYYQQFGRALEDQKYKIAAFLLHQATEALYSTISLVFTNYKPKTHFLDTLGSFASSYDSRFITIFPQTTDHEKECFKLLNKAYVDARYKKNYTITKEQLEYLAERIKKLQQLTENICKQKIESFT
ncbi:HEPN domain-containing protein [Planctomycetota bacterium]